MVLISTKNSAYLRVVVSHNFKVGWGLNVKKKISIKNLEDIPELPDNIDNDHIAVRKVKTNQKF